MLIVIEGIDGSGKTTLADGIARELGAGRLEFPDYSTATGQRIKAALTGDACVDPVTLQALMAVNKLEHIGDLRDAAAGRDTLVLTRYWQSALVYGGAIDGLSTLWISRIHSSLPDGSVNILVDCEPDEAIRRQVARGKPPERYEGKIETMREVRDVYLGLWNHYAGPRWPVISSETPAWITQEAALMKLRPYIAERRFQ
jgi:dTMP kinase